jgi:hypothetical protein
MITLLAEAMYFMDLAASGLPGRFKRVSMLHPSCCCVLH